MYKLLKKHEQEEIAKIHSKLYGPAFLSKDLKSILEEMKFLLGLNDALIFLHDNNIKEQVYIGNAQKFWEKYPDKIKKASSEAMSKKDYVLIENFADEIKVMLVIPIKNEKNVLGVLIILNDKIDYEKNRNIKIIKFLESQIGIVLRKAKEREQIFHLFGQYLDKRLISRIMDNPELIQKPEMIDLVVIFADLENFTEIINDYPIDEVFSFLSKILYEFTKVVNINSGIVDKFVGDQIIGIFGLIDNENKEENSIKSAIELQKILKNDFNKYKIGVKVAVVKDKMLYGNLGGKFKSDLTVVGKGVNLASRMCESARKGEILINKLLYNFLKDKYEFEFKGTKKFKGFNNEEEIYNVKY
ncbi:MAG: adenylate/guanylate cyclase domain-containing protein [Candidatus Pacearchaeota archaeon]